MNPEDIATGIRTRLKSSAGETDARTAPVSTPPRIHDHELLRRIGGGSYGDVWLARSATGSHRAIKVVWRQNFSSDRPYEREFRGIVQFEPISRSHPGVVNVLHVGRNDVEGFFFYVMELADSVGGVSSFTSQAPSTGAEGIAHQGTEKLNPETYIPRTLAADLKARGRLNVMEVLELGVQLANALGHVHRNGLVHRDVKPSNVIFVNGQAKLADIGLVAGRDEARSFVGTEGFIPPEGPGTERADLFSLGRLLYEAATGKDRCDFPELPPDLDNWPADHRRAMLEVNEILARLCAPAAALRHKNAAELAGDLNLVLAGHSVRKAYGVERRLRRAIRISIGAVGILAVAAVVLLIQRIEQKSAEAHGARETVLRKRAERAEREGHEQLRESLRREGLALAASSEMDRRTLALAALRQAAAIRPGRDLRIAAATAFATPELRVTRKWPVTTDGTAPIAFDATLKRYARLRTNGTISVHTATNDAELVRLPEVGASPEWVRFSPDGRWLVVHGQDGSFYLWNLEDRTPKRLLQRGAVSHAFSRDSRLLAVGCGTPHLHLFETESGRELWRMTVSNRLDWLDFHPAAPFLAGGTEGTTLIQFLSLADGRVEREIPVPALGRVARWTRDGTRLIVAHADFAVRVWNWPAMDGAHLVIRLHRSEPVFLATDPGDNWLATAGWDSQFGMFDLADGRTLLTLRGSLVVAATDRPSFAYLNGDEWTLAEFDPAVAFETIAIHEHHKSPRPLAFSPDGAWLATGGGDGVRVLRWPTHEVFSLTTNLGCVAIGFSGNSKQLFGLGTGGTAAWELDEGSQSRPPHWRPMKLSPSLSNTRADAAIGSFSRDHQHWVAATRNASATGWGWLIGTLDGLQNHVESRITGGVETPDFSPDGHWLAWGNWRGEDAHVVDLAASAPPLRLAASGSVSTRFSPNGRFLAVGGSREARLLETGTWRELHMIPREPPGSLPPLVDYTPDSAVCAIVFPPDQVQLIDTGTGEELIRLRPGSLHLMHQPAFSPDGQTLVVTSTDHHLLIWNLTDLRARLAELGLDWPSPAQTAR